MIEEIFKEIQEEARSGVVLLKDDGFDVPVRMCFSFNEHKDGIPSFTINDLTKFKKALTEYVYCALEFYNIQPTRDNIKSILTYVWSNITPEEMQHVEDYLERRIAFFNKDISKEIV